MTQTRHSYTIKHRNLAERFDSPLPDMHTAQKKDISSQQDSMCDSMMSFKPSIARSNQFLIYPINHRNLSDVCESCLTSILDCRREKR